MFVSRARISHGSPSRMRPREAVFASPGVVPSMNPSISVPSNALVNGTGIGLVAPATRS